MTRLLAVVLFAFSTAATQAQDDTTAGEVGPLELESFVTGALITAEKFNKNQNKKKNRINANTVKADNNSLEITGLASQVNSFIPLPTTCTAGQTITFDGSAWACADVPPLLPVGCSDGQTIKYGGGVWNCHD